MINYDDDAAAAANDGDDDDDDDSELVNGVFQADKTYNKIPNTNVIIIII